MVNSLSTKSFIQASKVIYSLFYSPSEYEGLFQDLVVRLNLKDCLLGFVFDTARHACVCSPKINAYTGVFCDFDKYQITKTKQL